jgi:hypothetical protein
MQKGQFLPHPDSGSITPIPVRVLGLNSQFKEDRTTRDGRQITVTVTFIDVIGLGSDGETLFTAKKNADFVDYRFSNVEGLDVLDGRELGLDEVVERKMAQQAERINGVKTPDGTTLDLSAALAAAE